MRTFVASLALAMGLFVGCGSNEPPPPPPRVQLPQPTVRLFVLTDMEGYLEPCGCTSRPLGGVDRLAAKLASHRADGTPSVLVAAGDLFFRECASCESGGAQANQDEWQAETLVDVLGRLDAAAVTPGRADWSHGSSVLASLTKRAEFPLLASDLRAAAPPPIPPPPPPDPTAPNAGTDDPAPVEVPGTPELAPSRIVRAGGLAIGIFGISQAENEAGALPDGAERVAPVRDAARDAVRDLRQRDVDLVIALVRGARRTGRLIADIEGVDFVVQGGIDEPDASPPARSGRGYVLHAGRQGQGVLVVDIHRRAEGPFRDVSDWTRDLERTALEGRIRDLRQRIEAWERDRSAAEADVDEQKQRLRALENELDVMQRAVPDTNGNVFSARYEELPPEAPRDAPTRELLTGLFRRINEHNRTALANLLPPPVPEGQPSYVGSAECRSCHAEAYAWWQGHNHGRAYQTLVDVFKEYNLSCVGCHVTGYNRPGGATVTHNLDGKLVNVGCESCHGPGSAHIADPAAPSTVVRDTPERTCIECHNPDHSDRFVYEAFKNTLRVPGHGLPLPDPE